MATEISFASNGEVYDQERPTHSRSSSLQLAKDLLNQLERDFAPPASPTLGDDDFRTKKAAMELARTLLTQLQNGNLTGRHSALELGKELITILGDAKNPSGYDRMVDARQFDMTRSTMHNDNVNPCALVEAPVADIEALVSVPDNFIHSTTPHAPHVSLWKEDHGRKAGILSKIIDKLHLGDSNEAHLTRNSSTKIISRHFRLPVLRESTTGAYAQALSSTPNSDPGYAPAKYPVLKSYKTLEQEFRTAAPTCAADDDFCTRYQRHNGAPAA